MSPLAGLNEASGDRDHEKDAPGRIRSWASNRCLCAAGQVNAGPLC